MDMNQMLRLAGLARRLFDALSDEVVFEQVYRGASFVHGSIPGKCACCNGVGKTTRKQEDAFAAQRYHAISAKKTRRDGSAYPDHLQPLN
jgi:hypothetical protein